MINQEEEINKDSNNPKNYEELYKKLDERRKSINKILFDDTSKSLDELIKIALDYCDTPNSQEKYNNRECFYSSIESICEIIKKINPSNIKQLQESFNNFFNEEKDIIRKYDLKEEEEEDKGENIDHFNYKDIGDQPDDDLLYPLFDHYQAFAHILQKNIKEIKNSLPKYSAKPIDGWILAGIVILIAALYIALKLECFN